MAKEIKKKIVMAGDFSVGKTSLTRRFVRNKFDDRYIATLGMKVSKKVINIDNYLVNCQVWDLSGHPEFINVQKTSFVGAEGALIVSDLTRIDTIKNLRYWVSFFTRTAGSKPFIIIGNKNDIILEDNKNLLQLNAIASQYKLEPVITSAKSGHGVEEAFSTLGQRTLATFDEPDFPRSDEELVPFTALNPLLQAEDRIVMKFCEAVNDLDLGMTIVRHQFDLAQVDFRYPSKKNLEFVVKRLIKAGESFIKPDKYAKFIEFTRSEMEKI